MAQYSTNHNVVEAYIVGTPAPAWVEQAFKDRLLTKFMKGRVITRIDVETPCGTKSVVSGDAIIKHADGSLEAVAAATFATEYRADTADLTSVLGETDTTPSEATGLTPDDPIVWEIDVATTVEAVGLEDLVAADDASAQLYSDATFETEVTGESTIALVAGTPKKVYIKVTSLHETLVKYYEVTITRAEAEG